MTNTSSLKKLDVLPDFITRAERLKGKETQGKAAKHPAKRPLLSWEEQWCCDRATD